MNNTTTCRLETAKLMASALGGLSDAEAGTVDAHAVAPPWYVELKEQCRADMTDIRDQMSELRSLHGRASLSKFDDAKGREDEVAVEVATQAITKLFRRCEGRLKSITNGSAPSSADDKVQKNVQRTLAVELQRLSIQFRKQQKQYLGRLRARDGGEGPAAGALSFLEKGDDDLGFDPGFLQSQAQKADTLNALVDERDREVTRIVASISELAQIMKDLSVLVIDQGTVLDRIDYNLEQTATAVEQGVRQLRRADKAQRRGTAAACVMILLVAVAAMGIVVLLKALLA